MHKISDESSAALFCIVWETFFFLWVFTINTGIGNPNVFGVLFLLDTVVQCVVLYYDTKLCNERKRTESVRRGMRHLSTEYIEYVEKQFTDQESSNDAIIPADKYIVSDQKL